jgi:hypothetical protein
MYIYGKRSYIPLVTIMLLNINVRFQNLSTEPIGDFPTNVLSRKKNPGEYSRKNVQVAATLNR